MVESGLFMRQFELKSSNKSLQFYQKEIGDVSCVIWDASLVLSHYIEKRAECNPSFFKDLKIVELGAGVGCVGIVAACLGADVVLTDLPDVLPLLQHNIALNRQVCTEAGGHLVATALRWGETCTDIKPPSLLLLADCVYYSEAVVSLVETIKQLSNRSTEILICQEERDTEKQRIIWKQFTTELNKYFKFTAVPFEEQHSLFRSPDIMLLKGSRVQD